jgi:parallel beta-helix repeat protein
VTEKVIVKQVVQKVSVASPGPQGATGPQGEQGVQGVQGVAGPGVATGGTAGQVLAKVSGTDFDTEWRTRNIPRGAYSAIVVREGDNAAAYTEDGALISSGAEHAAIIQAAVDNLPAGRTRKATVAVVGAFTLARSGASQIQLPSYTVLDLTEARLTLASSINQHCIRNADLAGGNTQIEVRGGFIDANRVNQSSMMTCIFLQKVTDSLIFGTHMKDARSYNLHIIQSTDVRILGCVGEGAGDDNFAINDQCLRVAVMNCIARNSAGITTGSSGFEVDDGSHYISFTNCVADGNAAGGFDVHNHADTDGPTHIVFNGCIAVGNGALGFNVNGNAGSPTQPAHIIFSGCTAYNNASHGYQVLRCSDISITGCTARGNASSGFMVTTEATDVAVVSCISTANTVSGFRASSSVDRVLFQGCIARANLSFGIIVLGGKVVVVECLSHGNTSDGIRTDAAGTVLIGNKCTNNTSSGIRVFGVDDCVVAFNHCQDNTVEGIRMDTGCDRTLVLGNTCTRVSAQTHGIRMTGAGNDNRFIANSSTNHTTANYVFSGTGNIRRDNAGFVTHASGTATVATGTTSIAVTHGLAATPVLQDIKVTPTNAMGLASKFWITSPTSTQFTINVDADPTTDPATFAWQAVML